MGAEVAQLVEHSTENAGVVSSILTLGTLSDIFGCLWAEVAQLVEHLLAKEKVAGSNPVFRSIFLFFPIVGTSWATSQKLSIRFRCLKVPSSSELVPCHQGLKL